MKLPQIQDLKVEGKKVLLRTNYDVPLKEKGTKITTTTRIDESLPTIEYLLKRQAEIIIISHLGRPKGKVVPRLSLKPVSEYLGELLEQEIPLVKEIDKLSEQNESVVILENLRFWPEEIENNRQFALKLADEASFFINDAFACAHRFHASVVSLPEILPSALGLDFLKEIEVLSQVKTKPQRPLVVILGGSKGGKLERIERLANWADYVLVGGKLVGFLPDVLPKKVIRATLNEESKDITLESIKKFKEIIGESKTVVWTGPMGVFEEKGFAMGTEMIAKAVVESKAFSVVGGGDTEAALNKIGLEKSINFVSSGGGAMLEFLSTDSLPGIEAIKKDAENWH